MLRNRAPIAADVDQISRRTTNANFQVNPIKNTISLTEHLLKAKPCDAHCRDHQLDRTPDGLLADCSMGACFNEAPQSWFRAVLVFRLRGPH